MGFFTIYGALNGWGAAAAIIDPDFLHGTMDIRPYISGTIVVLPHLSGKVSVHPHLHGDIRVNP